MPYSQLITGVCLLGLSVMAQASLIVAPHGSGRDSDLAGVVVAAPDDGGSTLLINPAGVVSRARKEAGIAIVPGTLEVEYKNPVTGYDKDGSKDVVNLGLWYGLGEVKGWSMGVGAYGSLGAAFDLPAAPEIGQTSPYLGAFGILNFGIVAGKQLTRDLRFGLELSPRYGTLESRSPSPFGDIHFKADGWGFGASAGLVYTPTSALSLGFAYRTPGFVKFNGDGYVGSVKQDVSMKMVTPQSYTAGLAYKASDTFRLLGQVAWSRFKDFEKGDTDFEISKVLSGPVIQKAHNRWRWGVAMEYEFIPDHVFRAGFTRERSMIDASALTPVFYDHKDDMIMAGYEINYGTWRLGFTTGYSWNQKRDISVADNPYYPGVYKSGSPVSVGIRFTKRLGE